MPSSLIFSKVEIVEKGVVTVRWMIQLHATMTMLSIFTCFARIIMTWRSWWFVRFAEWMKFACFCYLVSISASVRIVKVRLVFVPCVSPPSLLAWKSICNGIIWNLMLPSVILIAHVIFIIPHRWHTGWCCTSMVLMFLQTFCMQTTFKCNGALYPFGWCVYWLKGPENGKSDLKKCWSGILVSYISLVISWSFFLSFLNDDIFCFWKVCHISFNNWQICVCYFRSGIICIPLSANDTPLLCPAISFRVWNLSAINTWWSAYTFTPISGLCSINLQNLFDMICTNS